MLKSENVKIKIRKNIKKHYIDLGYVIDSYELVVKSEDLHMGSSAIVNVICDCCHKELLLIYKHYNQVMKKYNDNLYYCECCKYNRIKKTNIEKYGVENVMNVEHIMNKMLETQKRNYGDIRLNDKDFIESILIEKYGSIQNYRKLCDVNRKKTCIDKYGVDNVMKVVDIKEKGQKTCMIRYGEYNPMFISEFVEKSKTNQINTKIDRKLIIPEDKLTEFEKYKKIIRRLTYRYKKILFENWDGYDYYDGEFIKDMTLNKMDVKYPTIDHKTSVYYGFCNNIDPYIIGNINNLCITKRCINSSKCSKNSEEYIKKHKLL
ncbi:hypothetical protein M0Q50_06080 [bacterium]|jgi:hypothetical protein|nr:hypothetical protein [bacterium]